jgi:uncharacterized protein (DUF2147 family)
MRVGLCRRGWMAFLMLLIGAMASVPGHALAAAALHSPVGRWKTVDDKTGQVKSIVEIRELDGELQGRIVKLFNPPVPHPLCIQCSGTFRNRPVLGMRILWGMRPEGNTWTGGRILDPENGEIYRCTMSLEKNGNVLDVRGYIGLSIFGRTERWLRVNR